MADQQLRVLHLIKSLDLGGIELLALDVANNAHRFGINLHVFCIGGGKLEPEFENSPAVFRHHPQLKFTNELIDPATVWRLRKYIQKKNIQIIHCHFASEGLHALSACIGLPGVRVVQGYAVDFRINRKIDNLKFRYLGRCADAGVALTRVLLNQVKEYGCNPFNRCVVIYNGVDPERITYKGLSTIRKELKLPAGAVLGGMVGNFYNGVRNQLLVCKALSRAIKENSKLHFVFAGGSTNQWIKKNPDYYQACVTYCRNAGISHRVHFIGLRKDIPNILAGLDFYVHSTNYDTFGIAPVEAALHRLPVIANNHPVFEETSHNGRGMWLYENGDVRDLSGKIEQLATAPELRKKLGQQHYLHATKHYHIDNHLRQLQSFYASLLKTG